MQKKQKKQNKKSLNLQTSDFRLRRGFSLIEVLAAITIFSIIIVGISDLFISGIRTQRRILATQELSDQTSYALEYMSRALRMAKKDTDGSCLTGVGPGYNYEATVDSIKFIDYKGNCTEFLKEGTPPQIWKEVVGGDKIALTSASLQVNDFRVYLSGEGQSDQLQPKATIFLDISGRELPDRPRIQIQTTISQRNLDTPF